jgi:glycosyltransferase involved in cell wall biosynthesis
MTTRLTVLNIAYARAPVGPDAVGGAEQVLTHIDHALVAAGHRSIVVACDGSQPAGDLVRATPDKYLDVIRSIDAELIHLHGIDFHDYLPPPGVPTLVTLHLPISWYPAETFQLTRPKTYLNCVSASQRRDCPNSPLLVETISNGVPQLSGGRASSRARRNYAMALGRICPEKGFHIALAAACRARVPLFIGGLVFPYEAHQRYFDHELAPRLCSPHRFLGPLNRARKQRLLSGARCLLVPSLVPETSSLVAMEALSCGTPVVAFRKGALSEIVEDGKTGFLVDHEKEMAEAIHASASLDPALCREMARHRFSVARMTEQYLALYQKLLIHDPGLVD